MRKVKLHKVTGFDLEKETVDYVCKCGSSGTVSMKAEESSPGALTGLHGGPYRTTVEPFGKDHATAGVPTIPEKRISREIYNYEPPHPIVYEVDHVKRQRCNAFIHRTCNIINDISRSSREVLRYLIISRTGKAHRV